MSSGHFIHHFTCPVVWLHGSLIFNFPRNSGLEMSRSSSSSFAFIPCDVTLCWDFVGKKVSFLAIELHFDVVLHQDVNKMSTFPAGQLGPHQTKQKLKVFKSPKNQRSARIISPSCVWLKFGPTRLSGRLSLWLTGFILSKARDMQQMVKLEEEMDRRPATVVWMTETDTHKQLQKQHGLSYNPVLWPLPTLTFHFHAQTLRSPSPPPSCCTHPTH